MTWLIFLRSYLLFGGNRKLGDDRGQQEGQGCVRQVRLRRPQQEMESRDTFEVHLSWY